MNDIDFGNYSFVPFETFTGVLDGNGFALKNLNCNSADTSNSWTFVGLIRYNRGIIVNLGIESGSITVTKSPKTAAATGYSESGRASCRERVCQYVEIKVVGGALITHRTP